MPPFTTRQQKALALAPKVTSSLSFIGSFYIIWKILRDPLRRPSIKYRLLTGLSILDCIFSAASFLTTWPSPVGTRNVYGAVGTEATCTIQGFFFNFAFGCAVYNASLGLFFLLVVKLRRGRRQILQRLEWCTHIIAVIWPIIINIMTLSDGAFNNAQQVCWIAPLPLGCKGEKCLRGRNAKKIRLSCAFPTIMACLSVATISMILLYLHVRSTERASMHRRMSGISPRSQQYQNRKSQLVMQQALLYLLAMYIPWVFSVTSRWIFIFTGKAYFWLILTRSILNPSQGMFNVFIYMRSSLSSGPDRIFFVFPLDFLRLSIFPKMAQRGNSVAEWKRRREVIQEMVDSRDSDDWAYDKDVDDAYTDRNNVEQRTFSTDENPIHNDDSEVKQEIISVRIDDGHNNIEDDTSAPKSEEETSVQLP